jgi:hypothetical protein
MRNQANSRRLLLREFEEAPPGALLSQAPVAAWLNCSEAKLERDRVMGRGLPYVVLGRLVRYRKCDVVAATDPGSRAA